MKKCVKIVVAVVATLFVACLLGLIITGAKIGCTVFFAV